MPLTAFVGSVVPPIETRFGVVVTDSYSRNLGFSKTYNFRDVGGYAGLDGRSVRWRRLFRSDALHRLGEADAEAFAALGVRTVIDLRRPKEIERYGRVAERYGLDYQNHVLQHVDWEEVEHPADTVHERWLADRRRPRRVELVVPEQRRSEDVAVDGVEDAVRCPTPACGAMIPLGYAGGCPVCGDSAVADPAWPGG